jgi:hypothetical protein
MAVDESAENEPFIAVERENTFIISGAEPTSIHQNGSPTAFIWALTLAAGISGLLFGYE